MTERRPPTNEELTQWRDAAKGGWVGTTARDALERLIDEVEHRRNADSRDFIDIVCDGGVAQFGCLVDTVEFTDREKLVAHAKALGWHSTKDGLWYCPQCPERPVKAAG